MNHSGCDCVQTNHKHRHTEVHEPSEQIQHIPEVILDLRNIYLSQKPVAKLFKESDQNNDYVIARSK